MWGIVCQFLSTEFLEKDHITLKRDLVAGRRIPSPDGKNVIPGPQVATRKKEHGGEQKEV